MPTRAVEHVSLQVGQPSRQICRRNPSQRRMQPKPIEHVYEVSSKPHANCHVADGVFMFDWFGLHPALRWISPAYLPGGLTDLKGNVLYSSGWHFGFNFPAFLVVMILTVVLVLGIRESANANNTMVILKIAAILAFVIAF